MISGLGSSASFITNLTNKNIGGMKLNKWRTQHQIQTARVTIHTLPLQHSMVYLDPHWICVEDRAISVVSRTEEEIEDESLTI